MDEYPTDQHIIDADDVPKVYPEGGDDHSASAPVPIIETSPWSDELARQRQEAAKNEAESDQPENDRTSISS